MEWSRVRQSSLLIEGERLIGVIIYFSLLIFQMTKQGHEEMKGLDHQGDCHRSYPEGQKGLPTLTQSRKSLRQVCGYRQKGVCPLKWALFEPNAVLFKTSI